MNQCCGEVIIANQLIHDEFLNFTFPTLPKVIIINIYISAMCVLVEIPEIHILKAKKIHSVEKVIMEGIYSAL